MIVYIGVKGVTCHLKMQPLSTVDSNELTSNPLKAGIILGSICSKAVLNSGSCSGATLLGENVTATVTAPVSLAKTY